MATYSICDVCNEPLDLCQCGECKNCGDKTDKVFCSEDCEQEWNQLADDKIKDNFQSFSK